MRTYSFQHTKNYHRYKILENHQDRPPFRQAMQLIEERLQRQLLLSLRLNLVSGLVPIHGHREQGRDEGQGLACVPDTLSKQGCQFSQLGLVVVTGFESGRPFELRDEGVKRTVPVMRGVMWQA